MKALAALIATFQIVVSGAATTCTIRKSGTGTKSPNPCETSYVQKAGVWASTGVNQFLDVFAAGDSKPYSLERAQKLCADLGTSVCGGVTCCTPGGPAPSPPPAEVAKEAAAEAKTEAKAAGAEAKEVAADPNSARTVNAAPTCVGVKDEFKKKEIDDMVKVINQMRCVTGAPAIKWDHDLMCQAQKGTDRIGDVLKHVQPSEMPIKAGENLASGHSVDQAAYMWFSEYLMQGPGTGKARYTKCGHYVAMSWNSNTKFGCGILNSGKMQGFVRCQFAGPKPPMWGSFAKHVGSWDGNAAKLTSCGLDAKKMKEWMTKFKGWGMLTPVPSYAAGIGLYDIETDIKETDIETDMPQHFTPMFFAALAVTGVALVALGVVVGRRTRVAYVAADDDEELLQDSIQ